MRMISHGRCYLWRDKPIPERILGLEVSFSCQIELSYAALLCFFIPTTSRIGMICESAIMMKHVFRDEIDSEKIDTNQGPAVLPMQMLSC